MKIYKLMRHRYNPEQSMDITGLVSYPIGYYLFFSQALKVAQKFKRNIQFEQTSNTKDLVAWRQANLTSINEVYYTITQINLICW